MSEPIGELVQEDLRARMTKGRDTYGTDLYAHNGRDALVDAYQEALDLCMYLRQAIEERDNMPRRWMTGVDAESPAVVEQREPRVMGLTWSHPGDYPCERPYVDLPASPRCAIRPRHDHRRDHHGDVIDWLGQ